jgi:hypothetical protein
MKPALPLGIGLLLTCLPACSEGTAADKAAIMTFERFQAAMFARDAASLRALVTVESRDVIAQLPLDRLDGQQPLVAIGCEPQGTEQWITVRDPNQQDHRSTFVVVRENGRLVVDLLATAAHQAEYTPHQGPQQLEPRQLTAEERQRLQRLDPASLR